MSPPVQPPAQRGAASARADGMNAKHRRPRRDEPVALRRVLDRRTIEAFLAGALGAQSSAEVVLVDTDGTPFAGGGKWLTPRISQVRRALAEATDAVSVAGMSVRPLHAHSRLVGGLVVEGSAADDVVDLLQDALGIIVGQALDARDLGQETLDRYREINVLYRLGETVGALLDADEIPGLLLYEAEHAIKADATAVLLEPGESRRVAASAGTARLSQEMIETSSRLIDQVVEMGQPSIMASPAIASAHLGSLLCVPIRARDRPIGVVLLGRRKGRAVFSAGEEKLLLAIATEGGVAYDRALLLDERVQRERLEEELSVGRRIQLSLLPASSPHHAGWEFAAVYRAARQVGGDFYDFIETPEAPGTLGLIIGDVTGKGVPAALLMASTRAILRASSAGRPPPSVILERTNEQLLRDGRAGLFVTALYGSLDLITGDLVFASGGHDPPLWIRGDARQSRLLTTRGTLLGAFGAIRLEDRHIRLAPGDTLVLYTDGVTEARDRVGRLFGERRLRANLTANAAGSAEETAQAVLNAVSDFVGNIPPSDDLTLVVVRRQGAHP